MVDISILKQTAACQWPNIWQAAGVPPDVLTGKHIYCPGCTDRGKDKFRIVRGDRDGTWFCNQNGDTTGGDGFRLLQHIGMTPAESFRFVAEYLGIADQPITQEQRRAIHKRKQAEEHDRIDRAIAFECHILWQTTSNRVMSRKLERDAKFRELRPEWAPYPVEVWPREIQAAKRLMRALGIRYGL
jgi:phage/plasmid primase-like uncharacterized protein